MQIPKQAFLINKGSTVNTKSFRLLSVSFSVAAVEGKRRAALLSIAISGIIYRLSAELL